MYDDDKVDDDLEEKELVASGMHVVGEDSTDVDSTDVEEEEEEENGEDEDEDEDEDEEE